MRIPSAIAAEDRIPGRTPYGVRRAYVRRTSYVLPDTRFFRISTHHGRDSAADSGVRGRVISVRQPARKGKGNEGEDGGYFEF